SSDAVERRGGSSTVSNTRPRLRCGKRAAEVDGKSMVAGECAPSRTMSLLDTVCRDDHRRYRLRPGTRGKGHQVRFGLLPTTKKPLAKRLFGMSARSWKTFEPYAGKHIVWWSFVIAMEERWQTYLFLRWL